MPAVANQGELGTSFTKIETGTATIVVDRDAIPNTDQNLPVPGKTEVPEIVVLSAAGVLAPNALLVAGRQARITLNSNELVLSDSKGYLKASLHEIGHLMGLGDHNGFNGSTVMNQFRLRKELDMLGIRDDLGGNVADRVTYCDRRRAKEAATRPWP
jgi:hypothetical protein